MFCKINKTFMKYKNLKFLLILYTCLGVDKLYTTVDKKTIIKERQKARELRQSNWWKNLLSKGLCYYCGQHFSKNELTMDHIVPIARGGKSTKNNIVVSCKACNTKKGLKTPVEEILENLKK